MASEKQKNEKIKKKKRPNIGLPLLHMCVYSVCVYVYCVCVCVGGVDLGFMGDDLTRDLNCWSGWFVMLCLFFKLYLFIYYRWDR